MTIVNANLEIAGQQTVVECSLQGYFTIRLIGGDPGDSSQIIDSLGSGDTLERAKAAARQTLAKRKVKVEVKFRTVTGEHGVATGIHARNRTVLVRLDGDATTLSGISMREGILKPDTPESVIDRWQILEERRREAVREAKAITDEWGMALFAEVQRAIEEKAKEQDAAS